MTPETTLIIPTVLTKTSPQERLHLVESQPEGSLKGSLRTALRVGQILEVYKNPNLAQIVWNNIFQHMSPADFFERDAHGRLKNIDPIKATELEEYPFTIAGRLTPFHAALEEINLAREQGLTMTREEVKACVLHPDGRVASKIGKNQPIQSPELLAFLLARTIDSGEAGFIIKRQKAMGFSDKDALAVSYILEKLEKVHEKEVETLDRDTQLWLKAL